MPVTVYSVPQVVNLTVPETTGPGADRMNYPVNRTDFRIVRGVTNEIEFFVRDIDRKPVDVDDGVISIHVMDRRRRREYLTRPLTVTDAARGLYRLAVAPEEVADWPMEELTWTVTVRRPDGSDIILWTDRDYGPHGFLTVTDGPWPEPLPPVTLLAESLLLRNDWLVSEAVAGAVTLDVPDAVHSLAAYLTGFVGTILVEGSLVAQPSTEDTDWFEAERVEVTAPATETRGITVIGRLAWMRVRIRQLSGSVEKILIAR